MSGMAGNITAFSTVFTCDLYQTYLVKNRPDSHYLTVGKWATVWGTLLSCLSAYIALNFDNLFYVLTPILRSRSGPLLTPEWIYDLRALKDVSMRRFPVVDDSAAPAATLDFRYANIPMS